IESLQEEGHVSVQVLEGHYRIRITREGVVHIRLYNEFYRKIYSEQIRDHYRFTQAPFWLRDCPADSRRLWVTVGTLPGSETRGVRNSRVRPRFRFRLGMVVRSLGSVHRGDLD